MTIPMFGGNFDDYLHETVVFCMGCFLVPCVLHLSLTQAANQIHMSPVKSRVNLAYFATLNPALATATFIEPLSLLALAKPTSLTTLKPRRACKISKKSTLLLQQGTTPKNRRFYCASIILRILSMVAHSMMPNLLPMGGSYT